MARIHAGLPVVLSVLVAGCASHEVAVVPPPVVATIPVAAPAMPKGAYPGMVIPARLADGTYPTPNRGLSEAATLWHLRAALNVAALACRGPQEGAIVAGYNAMLGSQKPVLTRAEATLAAQYKAGGGDWQDRYDDSMTRLYNFFSQSPARDAFCDAAAGVLAQSVGVPAEAMPAFAAQQLPVLEAPFTDFYRAYDAWRSGATQPLPMRAPVYAAVAPTPVAGSARVVQAVPPAQPYVQTPPRLQVDPSVLQ